MQDMNNMQNLTFISLHRGSAEAEVSQCAFVLTTVGEELGKRLFLYLT